MANRSVSSARSLAGSRTLASRPYGVDINLVYNGNFEIVPPFTAATTAVNRDINGTAGGINTQRSNWGWFIQAVTGTCAAKFDTSISHSGSGSLKMSLLAAGSRLDCSNTQFSNGLNARFAMVQIQPSTTYVMTCWTRMVVNSGSTGSSSGLQLSLIEYNYDCTTSGQTTSAWTGIIVGHDWTFRTKQFTTTSTSHFLRIRPLLQGNTGDATLIADAWFDQLTIVPLTPTTRGAVT